LDRTLTIGKVDHYGVGVEHYSVGRAVFHGVKCCTLELTVTPARGVQALGVITTRVFRALGRYTKLIFQP